MPSQTTVSLTTVFSEVLSNLAFLFVDEEPVEPVPGATWLETMIGYYGPETGTLKLQCTRDFGLLLAANLLGVDPEDEEAGPKAIDAVKELMNIVCGQFITAMHGTEQVFDLTIPQTRELEETPDDVREEDPSMSTITVAGHPIQFTYTPGAHVEST